MRLDRVFAGLLFAQWLFGIGIALWLSPREWEGSESSVHPHVWAALILGAIVAAPPIALALLRPGAVVTRHAIAFGQMAAGALLIHLTGGRIETHFHVFGSLAFLAFYRDYRVLITASLVVIVDHIGRGIFLPMSIYGVATIQPLRWFEHAGWVVFEDVFLFSPARAATRDGRDRLAPRAPRGFEGRRGQVGGGARGQPREERVPRQHEPRDPHADDRDPRLRRPPARSASATSTPSASTTSRRSAATASTCSASSTTSSTSRRSRPAADRREHRLLARADRRRGRCRCMRVRAARQGARLRRASTGRRSPRRSAPTRRGCARSCQPGRQRDQVHRAGRRPHRGALHRRRRRRRTVVCASTSSTPASA